MRLFTPLLAVLAAPALAGPVAVTVTGADGKPLAGAVVEVESPRAPAAASLLAGPFTMAQRNIAFQPHILIVPVGASVAFPNLDKVRHHVYSFSTSKRFELKLYGRGSAPSIAFDRAGVVALGCNIHDSMSGFIIVTATPYAAQTDASGRASFADVPPGPVRITVWHPSVRAPGNQLAQAATVTGSGLATTVSLKR